MWIRITSTSPLARRSGYGFGTGFTLLEILVAIVIFGVVVSLIFGSFSIVFSSADQINIGSDMYEMGTACLTRITKDLEAVHVALYPRYKPPDIDDPPEIYRFVATEESLGGEQFAQMRFTTLSHLPTYQGAAEGIAEIVYYAEESENSGNVIKRADHLYPYPEDFEKNDTDPVMCEHVKSFELVYYDHEGHEYKDWNSQDDDYEYGTPRSVAIELIIGDEQTEYVFTTEIALPVSRYQPVKR